MFMKTITVNRRQFTIQKATFEAQLRRFTLLEEAEKSIDEVNALNVGEIESIVRRAFHLVTYPSLRACTEGDVFTEQECYQVDNDDLELWLTTARELNPTWFPTPNQTEEEEKKIESTSEPIST